MNQKLIPILERLEVPVEFPKFFPNVIEAYRRTLAEQYGTQDDYVIASLLAAAATAIGANVTTEVQRGWRVRPNLFFATIGHKGSGKSPAAREVMAPLVAYEESLAPPAPTTEESRSPAFKPASSAFGGPGAYDDGYDDEWDDDDEFESEVERLIDEAKHAKEVAPTPRVVLNDCTGPALLDVLQHSPRGLVVHCDELAKLFIGNTGGTQRQTLCELADGGRISRHRSSRKEPQGVLKQPYACLLGGLTPDLLATAYSKRGDDGFLDRFLLVGLPETIRPQWPKDVLDEEFKNAWEGTMAKLLGIEKQASDAMEGTLDTEFTEEARDVFKAFFERMNDVAEAINMPASQRGVVRKMIHHAARLALIHRCLRWATGEFKGFGDDGALGSIDAKDAAAACEAGMFFFGRWILWRPELAANLWAPPEPVGLEHEAGQDPALLSLSDMATSVQSGIRLIERLIRYLRGRNTPVPICELSSRGPLALADPTEVWAACKWLVDNGQAEWLDGEAAIQLNAMPKKRSSRKPRDRRGDHA